MAYLALLALCCLLSLVSSEGRTMMQPHLDNVSNSTTAFLDSTPSTTTTTNINDVEGLSTLMKNFPALSGDVSSDPCYPLKLSWIGCSNVGDVRRVTALFLGAQNLYGYLPDFSSMDALQIIDLHRNSLYGSFPEFLGTFPELTFLDLSNNLFEGVLPASLANNKKIELNIAGNSLQLAPPATVLFPPPFPAVESPYCGCNSSDVPDFKRRKKIRLPRLARIAIPTCSVTMVGVVTYAIWHRYRRRYPKENHDHITIAVEAESTTTAPSPSAESTPASTSKSPPPPSPPPSPPCPVRTPCGCGTAPCSLIFVVDEYY